MYLIKTPWILKKMYPSCIWKMPVKNKDVYLTFDDGPHPEATPFVLDQLKQHDAKASFFCIGKNVHEHQGLYAEILSQGHTVGNHTQNHLNGWKVSDKQYIDNIVEAEKHIDSKLFRPPYGRISRFQIRLLTEPSNTKTIPYSIIMWDVLSGDFDASLTGDQCAQNVLKNTEAGSIIVFHDSQKALPRLKKALPIVLEGLSKKGFHFKSLSEL